MNREYVHSVAIYQKYLMRLGELIIFKPWGENYHFSQQSEVFLYTTTLCTYSIYLSTSDLLSFISSHMTNMNLAVYGNGFAVLMTS